VAPTLVSISDQVGIALVATNVLVDQLGVPVPAVPTLVVAGAVAAVQPAWGAELFVAAVLACVLADLSWFLAGRRYGSAVMHLLCRISLSPDSCVSDTQRRFESWGSQALVFAKFVPGLSLIAPPLAGALRMRSWQFLTLSALGAILWVGCYLALGVLLREQIDLLIPMVKDFAATAAAIVGGLLALYVAYKWWQRRRFYESLRMARVSVEELYRQMNSGTSPSVLDVRSASARALEPRQVPGAIHVPREQVRQHLGEFERSRELIIYCTCPNEASAAQVAKLLINLGFSRVRPLYGGLEAWIEAGYPVETLKVTENPLAQGADAA